MAIGRWTPGRAGSVASPARGAAFRAESVAADPGTPSRRQSAALLSVLVVVAAAIGVASYVVRPDRARSFDLVHGSVFLADQVAPVGIDLASGRPTLRLVGADKQVGADDPANLSLVPVHGGTLLLDRSTGQFNMVDQTGFVIKHDGGGVLLPRRTDRTTSDAFAADTGPEAGVGGAAYLVRTGPRGTNVLLVNQSNVEAASQGSRTVRPRASLNTSAVAMPGSDATAAANGDLWALFTVGGRREIRQLSVPVRSDTGAQLASRVRGSVDGPAAIATATSGAPPAISATGSLTGADTTDSDTGDDTGSAAVAIASADRLVLFTTDGSAQHDFALAAQPGIDAVLPVSGEPGRVSFLEHGRRGWSLVSVGIDGSGLRGPTPIEGLPAAAQPARPSWSNGNIYTVDRAAGAGGRIYRIDARGVAGTVPGAALYPLGRKNGKVAEAADFGDAYVVARSTRVFVDSPSHVQAVALFTDGHQRPLVIRKSSAVDVSAAGGAEALTRGKIDPSDEHGNLPRGSRSRPSAGTQINNQVDCATTSQKPRVPVLGAPTPGSRSVAVAWTYPTLDPQDCIPSTYVVSARALSAGAPSPGGSTRVQGQTSVDLTGLYPSTRYELTVTAYLRGQSTTSAPVQVTTGREGPPAPTDLRVRADSAGNWVLNWSGCDPASPDCVPTSSWRVVPSVCDARGLSAAPGELDVTGDPSSRAQPQTVYRGGTALLGRGLSFAVIGTGTQGEVGTPSAPSGCAYSWREPDAGAISVRASSPDHPSPDGSTSITAGVQFADSPAADLGGVGGTLTYQLLSGGAVVETVGPTTDTSVQLDNVQAGQQYTVAVSASPPRHPDVVVRLDPVGVEPATADWPQVTLDAGFDPDTATTGTLTVSFGLGGTSARGEHFDLIPGASSLTCGSTSQDLGRSDVAIGQQLKYPGLSRFDLSGDCTVSVQVQQDPQHSTDPPLFGAGPSAVATRTISIPVATSTTTAADFTAQWGSDQDHPQVVVSYSGSDPLSLTDHWSLAVSNGSGPCGSSGEVPNQPVTIAVDPACVTAGGTFTVKIDYTYIGAAQSFQVTVGGTVPQPLNLDNVKFDAVWGGDAGTPTVNVTYTGTEEQDRLSAATWTEHLTSPSYPGADCGSDNDNPGLQLVSVPLATTTCPLELDGAPVTYVITIHVQDPYGQTRDYTPEITGAPPS